MKVNYVLTNWKSRLAYLATGAAAGFAIGGIGGMSIPAWVGGCICVGLLRIWAEIRGREAHGSD